LTGYQLEAALLLYDPPRRVQSVFERTGATWSGDEQQFACWPAAWPDRV